METTFLQVATDLVLISVSVFILSLFIVLFIDTEKVTDLAEFFKDDQKGQYSMMRLMSFLTLIAVFVITGYILLNTDKSSLVDLGKHIITVFTAAAFGGKAVQKIAETMQSK